MQIWLWLVLYFGLMGLWLAFLLTLKRSASLQRFVGFCLCQCGLVIGDAGLKMSVYGARLIDRSRVVKPVPFDGIPIGGEVPCNCPLCRDDLPSIVLLRSRPRMADTQPLKDLLN